MGSARVGRLVLSLARTRPPLVVAPVCNSRHCTQRLARHAGSLSRASCSSPLGPLLPLRSPRRAQRALARLARQRLASCLSPRKFRSERSVRGRAQSSRPLSASSRPALPSAALSLASPSCSFRFRLGTLSHSPWSHAPARRRRRRPCVRARRSLPRQTDRGGRRRHQAFRAHPCALTRSLLSRLPTRRADPSWCARRRSGSRSTGSS